MRKVTATAIGLAFAGFATPAQAHAAFGTTIPFWSGALHIAVTPLAIAPLIALGAALAAAEKPQVFPSLALAVVLTAVAAWLGKPLLSLAPAASVVVGLAGALQLPQTRAISVLTGALAGVGAGFAADVDQPTMVAGLGAGLAAFLIVGFTRAGFEKLEPYFPVGRRIVAAWVAAIGLLVGALSLVN